MTRINLNSHRSRVIVFAALLIVLLGSLVAPAPAHAQGCYPAHIVQPGENLFRIGLRYGYLWTVLAQYNGLTNPNRIFVGQVICIPFGSVNPPPPPPPPPPGGVYYPPPGVYPYIDFNTRRAGPGDTIVINGYRFPGNSTVDIYIAPLRTPYPSTPQATTTVPASGTFSTNFTIPASVEGRPLVGTYLSVIVVARGSGYYGYNYFVNTRPGG